MRYALVVGLILVTGCSKQPTALDVCKRLEATGAAAGCRASTPAGLGAGAVEGATFDLPSVPGKTGQVLRYGDATAYAAGVEGYGRAAALAGPHRYGSDRARIFVQANAGLGAAEGAKLRGVVEAL